MVTSSEVTSLPEHSSGTIESSMSSTLVADDSLRCPYCTRTFPSKRGLGVHKSSAHREQYNQESLALPNTKKTRWSNEESAMLARAEAELTLRKTRNMNESLFEATRNRTIDAIKSKRRQLAYKLLVQKFLEDLTCSRHTSDSTCGTSTVADVNSLPASPWTSPHTSVPTCRDTTVAEECHGEMVDPDNPPPASGRCSSDASTVDLDEFMESGSSGYFKDQSSQVSQSENLRMKWRTDGGDIAVANARQRKVLDHLVETLCELGESNPHKATLKSTIDILTDTNVTVDKILLRLDQLISGLVPGVTYSPRNKSDGINADASRRKKRAAEYKLIQRLYNRSRKAAARVVLNGVTQQVPITEERFGDFNAFWQLTMAPDQVPTLGEFPTNFVQDPWYEVLEPITGDEVKKAYPDNGSSPGPDHLTVDLLRKVPVATLVCLFNIFLYIRDVPSSIKSGRTILIPKTDNPSSPGEYRPITVASVLLRHFHKVLATRLNNALTLNRRQRGFRPNGDGCFENIILYLSLIRDARSRFQPLHVAVIDIKKAFDSVLFSSVLEKLTEKGAPPPLIRYLYNIYRTSSTYLTVGSFQSEIRPTRGVRQGDPLSPLLFNTVIDYVLDSLPSHIGYDLPSVEGAPNKINVLAFADDLVLCATTPAGLQKLLDIASEKLRELGLEINANKCTTLSLAPHRHLKRNRVDTSQRFKIDNVEITPSGVESYIKYLGVRVTSRGKPSFVNELKSLCDALGRAPLKPQQRLFLLKNFALPRLIYPLCMGDYNRQRLRDLDRLTRSYLRKWLGLPKDIPIGAFHCSVRDGGLGVLPFEFLIPKIRLKRLSKLEFHEDPVFRSLPSLPYFSKEKAKIIKDRERYGISDSPDGYEKYMKWSFYKTYDGAKLQEAALCPEASRWISDGTKFVKGHDFIYMLKARYNTFPLKSRCARGRNKSTACRHGCSAVETLTHVSSLCPVSHPARLTRHNSVLKYLYRRFQRLGCEVAKERRYETKDERGIWQTVYPDLVVKKDDQTYILDVHVCGDTKLNLDKTAYFKTAKYANNKDLLKQVKGDGRCDPIVLGITISCRGIIAPASAALLKSMGLSGDDFKVMSVKALEGTVRVFRQFMKSFKAPNRRRRKGAKTLTAGAVAKKL